MSRTTQMTRHHICFFFSQHSRIRLWSLASKTGCVVNHRQRCQSIDGKESESMWEGVGGLPLLWMSIFQDGFSYHALIIKSKEIREAAELLRSLCTTYCQEPSFRSFLTTKPFHFFYKKTLFIFILFYFSQKKRENPWRKNWGSELLSRSDFFVINWCIML